MLVTATNTQDLLLLLILVVILHLYTQDLFQYTELGLAGGLVSLTLAPITGLLSH